MIPQNRLNPVVQKVFGITPVGGSHSACKTKHSQRASLERLSKLCSPNSKNSVENQLYTAKVDQLFGPNRLAARYTYTNSNQTTPKYYAPTEPDIAEYGGHNGSLTFTEVIGPKAVNVAHIGVQYDNHVHSGPVPIPNVSSLLGLPTYQTNQYWPQFYFDSWAGTDNYWTGIDRDNPKDYPDQTITASDRFSYNRGNHQLMFGFETTITESPPTRLVSQAANNPPAITPRCKIQPSRMANCADTGSGLADFLLGDMRGLFCQSIRTIIRANRIFRICPGRLARDASPDAELGIRYEYWTPSLTLPGCFLPSIPTSRLAWPSTREAAHSSGNSPALYNSYVAAGFPIESAAAAPYPHESFHHAEEQLCTSRGVCL